MMFKLSKAQLGLLLTPMIKDEISKLDAGGTAGNSLVTALNSTSATDGEATTANSSATPEVTDENKTEAGTVTQLSGINGYQPQKNTSSLVGIQGKDYGKTRWQRVLGFAGEKLANHFDDIYQRNNPVIHGISAYKQKKGGHLIRKAEPGLKTDWNTLGKTSDTHQNERATNFQTKMDKNLLGSNYGNYMKNQALGYTTTGFNDNTKGRTTGITSFTDLGNQSFKLNGQTTTIGDQAGTFSSERARNSYVENSMENAYDLNRRLDNASTKFDNKISKIDERAIDRGWDQSRIDEAKARAERQQNRRENRAYHKFQRDQRQASKAERIKEKVLDSTAMGKSLDAIGKGVNDAIEYKQQETQRHQDWRAKKDARWAQNQQNRTSVFNTDPNATPIGANGFKLSKHMFGYI